MPNAQNVVGINERRTPEERKKIAKVAGEASGKARREKADLRQALKVALETEYTTEEGTPLTGSEKLVMSLMAIACDPGKGGAAVRAFETIVKMLGQDVPEQTNDDDMIREFLRYMRGD